MKYIYIAALFLFLSIQPILSSNGPFKLIKSIGDERDDYTIHGTADAVITETRDIYVLNAKGNFIAQYDWQGNFIRKIGQAGQGPTDFFYPRNLAYHNKTLYILDYGNHRIAEMNIETAKFQYYKSSVKNRFENMRQVIDGTLFLGVFSNIQRDRGRIGIMDKEGNLKHSFFKETPVKLDLGNGTVEFKDKMTKDYAFRTLIINQSSKPVCDYDGQTGEILVSFRSPDQVVRFFVYNSKGKLLKSFSYAVKDKRYGFSRYFLNTPLKKILELKKRPERFELDLNVFIYNEFYLGFLTFNHYPKGEKEVGNRKYLCIVFDKSGKVFREIKLNDNLWILKNSEGYLLGRILEEEIDKLYFYQLKL